MGVYTSTLAGDLQKAAGAQEGMAYLQHETGRTDHEFMVAVPSVVRIMSILDADPTTGGAAMTEVLERLADEVEAGTPGI